LGIESNENTTKTISHGPAKTKKRATFYLLLAWKKEVRWKLKEYVALHMGGKGSLLGSRALPFLLDHGFHGMVVSNAVETRYHSLSSTALYNTVHSPINLIRREMLAEQPQSTLDRNMGVTPNN
jgi:hypothetical protein